MENGVCQEKWKKVTYSPLYSHPVQVRKLRKLHSRQLEFPGVLVNTKHGPTSGL
jgi:hypothetical protein